jgi:hypothetical protein
MTCCIRRAPVSRATWLRAFCNVWTEAADPLIPAEEWAALAQPQAVPSRRDIAVGYDIAPDNESGAVVAAWRDDDGAPCVRVLHAAPGTAWMHPYLVNLVRDWQPAVLCADDGGPTRRLTDELRRTLGEDAVTTTLGRDFGTACEAFLTYCRDDRTLKHDGSATLARAIQAQRSCRAGDVTRFSRSTSAGPIAGLIARRRGGWTSGSADREVFSLMTTATHWRRPDGSASPQSYPPAGQTPSVPRRRCGAGAVTIRLDATAHTVVVTCSLCGWWQTIRMSKADGWAAGAAHDASVHPGASGNAVQALAQLRRRST